MSRFTAINLSQLPLPQSIKELSFEAILAEMKADLIRIAPEYEAVLAYASDPIVKMFENWAYREILVRAHGNDQVRAVLLATATGPNLEHLAALFGVARLTVTPADPNAAPPVSAVMESDDALRLRTQLALDGFSTAGSRAAYEYHARTADARVTDVSVDSPDPGVVRVAVLSNEGDGQASAALLSIVSAALNAEDVRPLCDTVIVQSATIVPYTVTAELILQEGPDQAVVRAEAEAELIRYTASIRGVGRAVRLSGLYAALYRPGVENVIISSPASDIIIAQDQAAHCASIGITIGGAA